MVPCSCRHGRLHHSPSRYGLFPPSHSTLTLTTTANHPRTQTGTQPHTPHRTLLSKERWRPTTPSTWVSGAQISEPAMPAMRPGGRWAAASRGRLGRCPLRRGWYASSSSLGDSVVWTVYLHSSTLSTRGPRGSGRRTRSRNPAQRRLSGPPTHMAHNYSTPSSNRRVGREPNSSCNVWRPGVSRARSCRCTTSASTGQKRLKVRRNSRCSTHRGATQTRGTQVRWWIKV